MDFACVVLCCDGKAVLSILYHDLFFFLSCVFFCLLVLFFFICIVPLAVDVHSVLLLL